MTSQSRRKHPTTPSPTTGRRTATSLAVLAALAAPALAADPPGVGPAPTRWAQTPATPPALPSIPTPTVMTGAPPPAGPGRIPAPPPPAPRAPSNVVVFQKPAGTSGGTTPAAPAPANAPAARTPQAPADRKVPGQQDPLEDYQKKVPATIEDPAFSLGPSTVLTREKVFQLTADRELLERITRELYEEALKRDKERTVTLGNFRVPDVARPTGVETPYQTKVVRHAYPPVQSLLEPHYVVHRRLLFEEKNADRYGWDAGIVQPFLSTAYFYKDVLLWPAHLASQPFDRYDSSAGKCRPGDPVPYYLYPPEIDLFGGTVGAGAIIGTVFLFP